MSEGLAARPEASVVHHVQRDRALLEMPDRSSQDTNASADSTATGMNRPEGAVNFNMGTPVESYAEGARMLDEAASVPGVKESC